jgi:CelD/BcsL family acetyltransferase involved in cellulose biosynthesis
MQGLSTGADISKKKKRKKKKKKEKRNETSGSCVGQARPSTPFL